MNFFQEVMTSSTRCPKMLIPEGELSVKNVMLAIMLEMRIAIFKTVN
jgi:hypothetical protein